MIPVPLLLVGLPLGLAPLIYLARWRWPRWERGLTLGVAGLLLGLAGLAFSSPAGDAAPGLLGNTFTVLGRAFTVEPTSRLGLMYVCVLTAGLFAASTLVQAGRYFVPAGLAVVGFLSGALCVHPFVFAALFLELAAALAVFVIGDEIRAETRGAGRYLVFMTLSMPFILLTGWLLEAGQASPEDISFASRAIILLALGFAVLLAVVPFHSWLPEVAEQAPPLAAVFVFAVMQSASVILLLMYLRSYTGLQSAAVYRGLLLAGGAMVLVGTLFVFGQRNLGRMMGYAVMVDTGAILLALSMGTPAGMEMALVTLVWRGLALLAWGIGLQLLRRAAGGDDFDRLGGLAREQPLAVTLTVLGVLSLAGFPLTAGFTGRWALMHLLIQIHPTGAFLLLLSLVSVSLVCLRSLAVLLVPRAGAAPVWVEGWPTRLVCGLGIVCLLGLGVFPQGLLAAVSAAAQVFIQLQP